MLFLRLLPAALALLVLGAHFLRAGSYGLVGAVLLGLSLLFSRRAFVPLVLRVFLQGGVLVWANVAAELIDMRRAQAEPYLRLALVLGGVALATGAAAALLFGSRVAARFFLRQESALTSAAACLIAVGLLGVVQYKVHPPMLLAERFWPSAGWLEIALLGLYAAWLVERLLDDRTQARARLWLWLGFGAVFFGQLLVGLLGVPEALMSGVLHLPVPALIVAGPLYRGEGLFMPILFGATLLVVGPAWCSHLCYIGAFDALAARATQRPGRLPNWARPVRVLILVLAVGTALAFRFLGADLALAAGAAAAFGLAGVVLMVLWSKRQGVMAHCSLYCPMGLLATTLGLLAPFRLRFDDRCHGCLACTRACRYGALGEDEVTGRRVAADRCTLCGDCVSRCPDQALGYRFFKLSPGRSRALFTALVIGLHAVFLGVARL